MSDVINVTVEMTTESYTIEVTENPTLISVNVQEGLDQVDVEVSSNQTAIIPDDVENKIDELDDFKNNGTINGGIIM